MTETCERCDADGNEVRLFDAIYEGRMISVCERCSIVENIPVVKKPDASQLKESEQGEGVFDRMKRLSGIREPEKEETFFQEDKLKELDSHPELERPETEKLNLIEHFHWEVMKNRRRKGLSQKQLAENLGESEIAVQMIEKGKMPENAESLIRKLEQIFQIRLKKISEAERLMIEREKRIRSEPVLLDETGQELEVIPEEEVSEEVVEEDLSYPESHLPAQTEKEGEEVEIKDEDIFEEGRGEEDVGEIKELDLRKTDPRGVTIGELKEMHRKKVEVTKQEQIEEQKKIEERRRILEALRERDRLKAEEKKKEEELVSKRLEEERERVAEERRKEVEERRRRESNDVDRYLGGSELLE